MGRKIPGAKHHGVKDPLKQQEQRLKILKQKINAPPSNPDDQPIPKSLTRLFEFKEKYEQKSKEKKQKNKNAEKLHPVSLERHENPVSSLARLPGETGRSFNMRINSAIHSINKRHVQMQEMKQSLDPDNYLPENDAREERFDYIQQKKTKRREKSERQRRREGEEAQVKLSRMQRWALKKKEKKAKQDEEADDKKFEPKYEQFKFGEVVNEPPSLHVKPKKAASADGAPRPGRRDLLLNKLLNKSDEVPKSKDTGKVTMDKKAKRKNLPVGVRMRLEQSQQDAIAAYRALKANAFKNK